MDNNNETRFVEEQFEEDSRFPRFGRLSELPAGAMWGAVTGAVAAIVVGFITIAIVSGMIKRASTAEKVRRMRRQLMKKMS